jgi:predicted O-linked N-acetylglucosamine transferase (SPINDLY family)
MNERVLQEAVKAHQAGNLSEAARLYGEVLRQQPQNFQALFSLGYVYFQAQRFEEAQRLIGDSIKLNPRVPEAFFTRGCALHRLNRHREALVCFDQALSLRPRFADALGNRGAALMALKHHDQALQSLDRALAIDSTNTGAWINRGCVLQELERHEEALTCFEKAIALGPGVFEAYVNRGSALAALKRYEEAAADYERALAINPDIPYARGNALLYRLHGADWRGLDENRRAIAADLRAGKRVVYPFVEVMISDSLEDQLQGARIWVANEAPPSPTPLWRGEVYLHDRIRVAYLSADLHAHATAHLMAGVFECHDRTRFETIAVAFGRDDKSEMRARLIAGFDRFIDVSGKSDGEIALMLRQMEIDVAVDLKGYTQNHRSGIFAFKPAPVQVSYIGYPGTMGAPYIDYILADRTVIPDEHRALYAEEIAYLPDSYQCNDAKRPIAERGPTRAEAGLPETGFVFCCFNNSCKIAPEMFDIWMRLLRQINGSVLWLLDDNETARRNLRREAEARGVAGSRLLFAPRVMPAEHLARHRLGDLFLDTLPYGAHTTASDALWAGVPVLTVLGKSFAGRVGASLLKAAGLPELIADSIEAYEALALELARGASLLSELKAKLARNRDRCPLFDTVAITRHLETAYTAMCERSRRGEAPQGFAVAGETTVAMPSQARSVAPTPQSAELLFARGCEFYAQNRPQDALAAFDAALAINPRFVEALINRGALLMTLNRYDEALQSLDAALAINPGMVEGWNNRGNALSALGRHGEAVASYDRVLSVRPAFPETLVNRATALLALRRMDEALASYSDALRARPHSADAMAGRANALFELKRFEDAIADYAATLKLDPGYKYARGNLAFSRLHCCDWTELKNERARIAADLGSARCVINPFQNLALSGDPANQARCAEIWVRDKVPPASRALWQGEEYRHEKIRVAYLSSDFRNHAVATAMAGVFEHHDRSRFETMAISWGPDDESDMRARLMGAFDRFIDVERESDLNAAELLRRMEVDIAVDLMGFTGECRPGILALRPAPSQVNFLGYPGTMGAAWIDHIIADRIVIPEEERRHYRENVVYLTDTYLPTDSGRARPAPAPTREQAGLPERGFVFCSFNNSYKFSPEMFGFWMRLLAGVEGSVLWLPSGNPGAMRNLKREAGARIAPERLIFAPFLPKGEDHLARLQLAGLFLDTLPYNAHATAADALWAGVPVLTLPGTAFAGRVAASLNCAIGLPEMNAASAEQYEALALELARDPAALAAVKVKLSRNRTAQALFDTPRYTRNLEAAYIGMWEHRRLKTAARAR